MTFNQAYAPAPKCSPTSNSILTGQTTAKRQFLNTAILVDSSKVLLEASSINRIADIMVTFPELIHQLAPA